LTRREHLAALLKAHEPEDACEKEHLRRMRELLENANDPFARTHFAPGHFTASAFVLDARLERILFIHHAKLKRWLQPGGHVDPGDGDVVEAVRRELQEETGYRAGSLKRLFSFYPSPGIMTERMHLVEARDLTLSTAAPEADERIRVGEFSKAQIGKLLREKKIIDGKSLVGLLWDRCR